MRFCLSLFRLLIAETGGLGQLGGTDLAKCDLVRGWSGRCAVADQVSCSLFVTSAYAASGRTPGRWAGKDLPWRMVSTRRIINIIC